MANPALLFCSMVMSDAEEPYNPLDLRRLGEGIARALLARPVSPLPPAKRFFGSGIYAIYYTGDFSPYEPIAERNRDDRFKMPIYVGKGIPEGRRTGGSGFGPTLGPDLFRRLGQHARTITAAERNLKLNDFFCRYLVVAPVWIPLGEELLIRGFSPLWNTVVSGFGNNDPGSRRYTQQRSLWDVLHPGRLWAEKCEPNPTRPGEIVDSVRDALTQLDDQRLG